jgi:serine phosphatase RsbU (regulator of sigma subunit)
MKYLSRAIPHLKKLNPGFFKFIVWNKKGKIEKPLTDEKGYKYLIRTIHKVFKQINHDSLENYPGAPSNLKAVQKKINFLRNYLGKFLMPKHLNKPFLRGSLGEIILADANVNKSHFWFQFSDKFGILCLISDNALTSNIGIKRIIKAMNRSSYSQEVVGMAEVIKSNSIFVGQKVEHLSELIIEIGKFENFSQDQLETPHYLLLIKMLTPKTRAFCFIPKAGNVIDTNKTRRNLRILALIAFLTILILFKIFVFGKNSFVSIRWKLALLFLFANGLPLSILGFLGYEYMHQKQALLLNEAQEETSQLLAEFDSQYTKIQDSISKSLNQIIDKLNSELAGKKPTQKDYQQLEKECMKFFPDTMVFISKTGKINLFSGTDRNKRSTALIRKLGKDLLAYINRDANSPKNAYPQTITNRRVKAEGLFDPNNLFFDVILSRMEKISPEQLAAQEKLYYWNILGDFSQRKFQDICMFTWSHNRLQQQYLKQNLESLNKNYANIKCFAMNQKDGLIYPSSHTESNELDNLFRKAFNLKIAQNNNFTLNGKQYAAFCMVGKLLNETAIIGLFPLDKIEATIFNIKLKLIIFSLLSLLLTIAIGKILTSQFLRPIGQLGVGVKAISEQNYRYRLPVESENEFGHLNDIFNRAIESLEDLEVAKIVQENLFPGEQLSQNNLEIFGKSVTMTRLGGDYFDFFKIDDQKIGILMGDVAGHGVPAALLMAMAKASVLMSEDQKEKPAEMLTYLHKVILSVKSKTIKRMMTCQYFHIDSETGAFTYANAGHCFPIIIRNYGSETEFIKLVGTPLGITKRPRYKEDSEVLKPGDIMLLYTDGIIESQNAQGKEIGFKRFTQALLENYSPDLKAFYKGIFNFYLNWTEKADDDITMVLVKLKEEAKE